MFFKQSENPFIHNTATAYWSVIERDTRAILIAQELALTINRHINNTDNTDNPDIPELKIKNIGYDGYNQ